MTKEERNDNAKDATNNLRDVAKLCIGIRRTVPLASEEVLFLGIHKVIEYEKDWIAKSIALGFEKNKVSPEPGSEVEYHVAYTTDGSVIVEGWQYIAEGGVS